MKISFLAALSSIFLVKVDCGILDPRHAKRREQISLDGLWKFSLIDYDGAKKSVQASDYIDIMAVPSSYNDISASENVRDHVGVVQYQRSFVIPSTWGSKRIWLRFGSVCYSAGVYINGELALSHEIGHLPFVGEITSFVKAGDVNQIEVLVNNTLTNDTIPQGDVEILTKQNYNFDFFNYAGIDRPVLLYTTEDTYINDITVQTAIKDTSGIISYDVVDIFDTDGNLLDRYELQFGVRELSWDSTSFKINGKPVYLRGFGRHEDSDIRGKGLDLPLILRDYSLIKWIGANSYRTSHYPYAEEIMDLADSLGIMIIDETPAVDTGADLLRNHKQSITELISRDKNRPSVVMWSAANEPSTGDEASEDYYREVIAHLKTLDTTRPVTIANNVGPSADHSGQFLDILSFNQYNSWYNNEGDFDVIFTKVLTEAEEWHYKYNKPVMITEYGADTLEGYHSLPSFIWSEEYQNELMSRNFEVFDRLRAKGWFVGEMIWNFADFKTRQDFKRVGGNKKGIFTRQRQPKQSAHLMRRRYWSLAAELDNATIPADADNYIIGSSSRTKKEL
ncbi:hypothetical protein NQ317_009103 [Molorchus minor]|uniref:Beta-glucuronidase n=1 Tax=Molorchus minor TaxID=1323400 RepID=A0ABQ9J8P4_9CUCU|nr:hypothetical protein NQ317_009103 [Molorchus minor]